MTADGAPAKLFAYPAQSNFSGVQHPLEWVAEARGLGWDVILDCAAFAPTNPLDAHGHRRRLHPDLVLQAVRLPDRLRLPDRPPGGAGQAAPAVVRRRHHHAGVGAEEDWYRLAPGATGFEDGTIDYLGLPAITIGIEHLEAVGVRVIHARVWALAGWLLEELEALRHSDGSPLVKVFGPADGECRGATIALYLVDPEGRPYDVYDVEAAAARERISVRSGCFCNPGDGEVAHRIARDDIEPCFNDPAAVTLPQCQQRIEDATGKVPNHPRVARPRLRLPRRVPVQAFAERYRDRPSMTVAR